MNYDMTQPCSLCPFRNDAGRLTVHPSRLIEFMQGQFPCHKTAELTDPDDNDEDGDSGGYTATPDSQHCAGALIMLEKMEQPHQLMRIAERLGIYDRRKLDMSAPVFGSLEEVYAAERQFKRETKRRRTAKGRKSKITKSRRSRK